MVKNMRKSIVMFSALALALSAALAGSAAADGAAGEKTAVADGTYQGKAPSFGVIK